VFTLDAGPLVRCQCPEGPATYHLDTGFFLVSPCLESKYRGGSQLSKMPLHASHVAPPDVNVNFSSTISSTCNMCLKPLPPGESPIAVK
jgi:hypothetical protein